MNRSNSNIHLPRKLYTADQVRMLDQLMIEHVPISALKLMRRAAQVVLSVVLQRWPRLRRLIVFVGTGNNGGDGYYIALLAAAQRIKVQVLECGDTHRLRGDAASARDEALASGVSCKQCDILLHLASEEFSQETVLVDALLGTGHKGALRSGYEPVIDWMNSAKLPIVSVDLPSGLNCDTGEVLETAVRAMMTVCVVGLKQGLFTAQGPEHAGEIVFHDLGLPEALKKDSHVSNPSSSRIDINILPEFLSQRTLGMHKGQCGNVLVVGGDVGLGGAAMLAAEGALRVGAGTVSLVTRSQHVGPALTRRPEIMVSGIDEASGRGSEQLLELLQRASVVVIGPGLGNSNWSHMVLRQVLQFAGAHLPVVVDADALNLIALDAHGDPESDAATNTSEFVASPLWIMTPHPGEASRLLAKPIAEIQADRFAAVTQLQRRWGASILLKGVGSVLCYPSGSLIAKEGDIKIDVCTEGNPGMASGGMGDILSGVIAGLVAQGLSNVDALRCGVCVHGEAADLAAIAGGERGLLASDLLPYIRRLANDRRNRPEK